ncbi:hypothetical protein [Lelliottia amnigena]|uniref:hypothetical protein n=1 Tax=Lelliottia amnigena TaxID=61646 RepID=UPI000FA977E0|nr:hypothetical protein [Lelliottia amnigena]MBM7356052.1 membrane protein YdbS with pleckstrin-like domain [Lelliottia amnigena]WSO18358.1 hypothetical protein VUJ45_14850 [Lelliottia amnigena]
MKVNEFALMESGFSHAEVINIKNNVQKYGGSLGSAIQDLANRFVLALCVIILCLAMLVLLLTLGTDEQIFSGTIGLLCGIAVALFVQPPVIAYKAWRYQRANRYTQSSKGQK